MIVKTEKRQTIFQILSFKMSLLEQLLDLKKTYNDITQQVAIFERDRAEMEVIRIQRGEEIAQLKIELAKTRTKIADNEKLYQAYLERIKKDDAKILKYNQVITDLKKELRKNKETSKSKK